MWWDSKLVLLLYSSAYEAFLLSKIYCIIYTLKFQWVNVFEVQRSWAVSSVKDKSTSGNVFHLKRVNKNLHTSLTIMKLDHFLYSGIRYYKKKKRNMKHQKLMDYKVTKFWNWINEILRENRTCLGKKFAGL